MPEDLTADQLLPTNPVVRDATVNLRKRDLDANEVQSFLDKAISGRGAGPGPGLPPPRAGWAAGRGPPLRSCCRVGERGEHQRRARGSCGARHRVCRSVVSERVRPELAGRRAGGAVPVRANQLRDQLATFWPGAGKVFCAVDSPIALAFLKRYPTPVDARGLGEQQLAGFLKRHSYAGRKPARELLARLRNGAEGRAGERDLSSPTDRARARVRPRTDRSADQRADDRSPATSWMRIPTARRSGRCSSPQLVAMRRDDARRDRRLPRALPSYRALAADAGQAPVAVKSGKAKHAQFRWACNHRPRAAFCTLADASRRHNPSATDIHKHARDRGASHTHATRVLGRAGSQVTWRLLARPRHLRPTTTHRPTACHRRRRLTQGV